MPKSRSFVLPASLAVLLAACAVLLWLDGSWRVSAVEPPELRAAPELYSIYTAPRPPDIRIGGFDRPRVLPAYEILQTERYAHDGIRGAVLIVDTLATTGQDLTLIARDIKARYADLDTVSVEFIDSEHFLRYNGGALIFNTAAGAYNAGFVYGPPNNKGYLVMAAD
ncbi:MAG TPA: hypothetical protein VJ827_12110 [Rubrobacter sp.]|nr:hypothetical protein [Rubrobacter sp.]